MNLDEESTAAKGIVRSDWFKRVSIFIGCVGLLVWGFNSLLQSRQNHDLIQKNEQLIGIVEDLEQHNAELTTRLDCRAQVRDRMDEAIGLGLVAVAQDNPAELEAQAQTIVAIANEEETC